MNCASRTNPRGFTLVELAIAITVLGLVTAVVTLSIPSGVALAPASTTATAITVAEHDAVSTGTRVLTRVPYPGGELLVGAFPDGRVVADSVFPRLPQVAPR